MYDGAFNRIERELRNEEGVANELDYVEQTSWVLFLKYCTIWKTSAATGCLALSRAACRPS